ncbi:alanyl-tRNA synthetase [Thermodesulfitimonas autotrophica]|uniref:Alanine--tRNA ligase n=1 Tax=Thermodesulfitimonas autotrophica TaxID=1894989 RepID=A0A3N5BFP9_9THEO|nr:alanine--tRNA ligase [Thermodesulfitimonas autotrophica]RPF46912.1 alanyl-tRNA synthetase [Thermodesulfitimonas autotrophica]
MESEEIRQLFLDFFAAREHRVLPSASLIPANDPSLLWTAAGMVPFKPYFTGTAEPEHRRVATCQKCLRTPDIESVGKTARHLTFFEMLGNFSFGDYFKEEAIPWAWELVTKRFGLSPEQLWVSVYLDDDEAYHLWRKVGVPEARIVRLGKETNFWEIGVGPCGPCSEIHFDFGPEHSCGPDCGVGCDCDRFLEIWNLVFIQFYRDEAGNYSPLAQKGIDTGMGLERIATVLQGGKTAFDTDLFRDVIEEIAEVLKVDYGAGGDVGRAVKVIADHTRAVTFAIADGALPSNEGRGYVIRRLLRRAIRFGKLFGCEEPFLDRVAVRVIDKMGAVYPELGQQKRHILRTIRIEEGRFLETLSLGTEILNRMIADARAQGQRTLSGEAAFKLYDTYGFPLELTEEICAEEGLTVDRQGFATAMAQQRERARQARETTEYLGERERFYREARDAGIGSRFTGYYALEEPARVLLMVKNGRRVAAAEKGETVEVVLDATPFYAEAGGQVCDTGVFTGPGLLAEIEHVDRPVENIIVHRVKVVAGTLTEGNIVTASVDAPRRKQTARNHTATHLLHQSLKAVLGAHVNQAGSLVAPDRLRFDFTHYEALTPEELERVEAMVNQAILAAIPVETFETTLAEARAMGAVALFGEKYGERVRVVKIGEFSIELCGGTHLKNTAEAGFFKIVTEGSVASGVRRIEAVTGEAALSYINGILRDYQEIAAILKVAPRNLAAAVKALADQVKELARENEALKDRLAAGEVQDLLQRVEVIDGVNVLASRVGTAEMPRLRSLIDVLRERLGSGVFILGGVAEDKVSLIVAVTPDLVKRGLHAGMLVKELAKLVDGGGGGRPELAQAGGKNPAGLEEALRFGRTLVQEKLRGQR